MKETGQHSATRLIKLHGIHAHGEHEFAVVDADQFDELNRWAWRAKPNAAGTRIYACRTERIGDRNIMHRLHRLVLGIEHGAPGDVHFLDGDPLNCRRENLRFSVRSETVLNTRPRKRFACCIECGSRFAYWARSATESLCSDACRSRRNLRQYTRRLEQRLAVERTQRLAARANLACGWCGQTFTPKKAGAKYCSAHCRHTHKNRRNAAARKAQAAQAPARPPIPCAHCGVGFVPVADAHVYCARRCRDRARYAKTRSGRVLGPKKNV